MGTTGIYITVREILSVLNNILRTLSEIARELKKLNQKTA